MKSNRFLRNYFITNYIPQSPLSNRLIMTSIGEQILLFFIEHRGAVVSGNSEQTDDTKIIGVT